MSTFKSLRSRIDGQAVTRLAAAGVVALSLLAPTTAAYAGSGVAKVSLATLNSLNLTKGDVASVLGAGATADSSKAGWSGNAATKAQQDKAIKDANSLLGAKKTNDLVSGTKALASCNKGNSSVMTDANSKFVLGPTYTFIAPDKSYLFTVTSQVYPTAGDGESQAAKSLATTSCVFSGVNSLFSNAFAGLGGSFKVSSPIPVKNANFAKGTYAFEINMSLTASGTTLPLKDLEIIAGKGNKLAMYTIGYFPVTPSAFNPATYQKAEAAFQALVIKKIAATSGSSL